MYQQHIIDWWRNRGYCVTVLSDWSLMCVSETAVLMSDRGMLSDAARRRLSRKWQQST